MFPKYKARCFLYKFIEKINIVINDFTIVLYHLLRVFRNVYCHFYHDSVKSQKKKQLQASIVMPQVQSLPATLLSLMSSDSSPSHSASLSISLLICIRGGRM